MSKFVLTAQLQLQAPRNARQVLNDVRSQLRGVEVPVEVKGARDAQRQVANVRKEVNKADDAVSNLGRSLTLATKRFAAFTLASRAVSLLTNNIANAVNEAIEFQDELVKIQQVSGASDKSIRNLSKTIFDLSTSLGVASRDLVGVSRVLAQAGFRASDLTDALSTLAKTELSATFGDIQQTAEGAIAIFNQFNRGGAALERQLGAVSRVAANFAVESEDLIGAIRRTGGVFQSAGGTLEEFLALFTSVRATTRESAESIATGLRTIFTRIQRPSTIAFLEELGVKLTDAEGRFIGPFKAAQKLGQAFADLDQGSLQFVQIAEELGGFRQIGKVIPLIQQYKVAQEALSVAQGAGNALTEDAAQRQQSLAVQIQKTKEEFQELIFSISNTASFQALVRLGLEAAKAFIRVADALKPLIPLIGALGAIKISGSLGRFIGGAGAALGQRRNAGGRILGLNSGGFVPGSGNRDTVPAMLTPGEFVIKKSSAAKLGPSTLEAMNKNRFASGGLVLQQLDDTKFAGLFARPKGKDSSGKPVSVIPKKADDDVLAAIGSPKSFFIGNTDEERFTDKADSVLRRGISEVVRTLDIGEKTANKADDNIINDIGVADIAGKIFEGVTRAAIGDFRKGGGAQQTFDVPAGLAEDSRATLSQLFNGGEPLDNIDYDNKLSENRENRASLLNKAIAAKYFADEIVLKAFTTNKRKSTKELLALSKGEKRNIALSGRLSDLRAARDLLPSKVPDVDSQKLIERGRLTPLIRQVSSAIPSSFKAKPKGRNSGGGISGSGDTVPALLTPGEFVVNKKSAQSIGYGNLSRMNRDGVSRFNKGGAVGPKKFFAGGLVGGAAGGGGANLLVLATAAQTVISVFQSLTEKVDDVNKPLSKTKLFFDGLAAVGIQIGAIALGVKFGKEKIAEWSAGVKSSKDAVDAEAQSRQKSSESAESGGGTGAASGGGEGGTEGNAQEQRIEKLNAAEKRRIDLLKKAEGNTKGVAAVEGKIVQKRKDVDISAKKLANTQQVLAARRKELNKTTRNANGQIRKQTDEEKARAKVLRAEIAQLQKNEATRQATLSKNISQRKQLQGTLKNLNNTLDANEKNASAAAQSLKRLRNARKEEDSVLQRLGGGLKRANAARKQAAANRRLEINLSKGFSKTTRRFATALKPAAAGVRQLTKEVRRLRSESKKGLGAGGRIRRGAGRAASAGLGALGLAGGIAAIGSQITSAISQAAERERDIATKKGDAAGAVSAAGRASVAESVGEVFTLGGFIEAATDPEGFVEKRNARKQRSEADAGIAAAGVRSQEDINKLNEGDFNREDGTTDFQQAAAASAKAFGVARKEISELADPTERAQAERKLFEQQSAQITALAKSGASLEELTQIANQFGGGLSENNDKLVQLAQSLVLAREAQQQLNKANIDSLKITSAFNAANAAVAQFTNTITAGADPLAGFLGTFQASKENIGIDAGGAITAIEQELVNAANQAGAGGLAASIQGQAATARDLNQFAATAGSRISQADLRSGDAGKEDLEAALLEGVDNPQIRKAVQAKVDALDAEAVATTDISKFVQEIQQEVGQLSKGFEGAAAALVAHNQQMNQLYAQREQLEQKAAQAQVKAIDLQIEAAKIAESAGGARVTSQALGAARVGQFNAVGGLAGVQLGTGSAQDIGRVRQQLSDQFFQQQEADITSRTLAGAGISTAGVFAGPQGRQDDTRPESLQAQQALITITKQQIAAKQEELKLIREKNKAEKSALDRLLGGDVAGFIAQQEAAGAAAALETGSASLAGLFDASALGAGFKELEARGGATLGAAQATLGAFGITDTSSARVLAGQTGEEQAAQQEIRALAGQLGGLAGDQAEFASSEIAIQDATIQAANVSFQRGLRETTENNLNAATGFARGGTVYASRGMFIPRGTDTVPAMLTPGEFVVNRAAVQRGNNLQMLQAMNTGGGASSPTAKSGGGPVNYYQFGGIVDAIGSAFGAAGNSLQGVFGQFTQSVEKLVTSKFSVQLDPVTINIEGGSFLQNMKQEIKSELLREVGQELQKGKINNTGSFGTSNSVLNKPTG